MHKREIFYQHATWYDTGDGYSNSLSMMLGFDS